MSQKLEDQKSIDEGAMDVERVMEMELRAEKGHESNRGVSPGRGLGGKHLRSTNFIWNLGDLLLLTRLISVS